MTYTTEKLEKINRIKTRITELEELHTQYTRRAVLHDNLQSGFKVVLNSVYGQFGNRYFSMSDVDSAEAVTISGQKMIKRCAEYINQYFKTHYNSDDDVLLSGDTDSCYLNISDMVDAILGKNHKWTKAGIDKVIVQLDEFVKLVNIKCGEFTKELFNSDVKKIEFKRETFCTEAVFLAKKRYVLHIVDSEGKTVDKFKYVGVDVKKNELPTKIKNILKDVIESSLKTVWSNAKFQEFINDIWEKFKMMSPDEISFLKSYSTFKETVGFMTAEKGAGAHAKAVICYNQFITTNNLLKKYDLIVLGEKFNFVYLKSNAYCINTIAFKDKWLPEFDEHFIIDKETMFEKVVLAPLKRFMDINGWSSIDLANQPLFNLESLLK